MGRPRKLTAQDVADILRWAQSRRTRKQIAAEKGVSTDTIDRITAGHRYRRVPLTDQELDALAQQFGGS